MRKIFNFINKLNWIQLGTLNGLIFGLPIHIFFVSVTLYTNFLQYLDSITPHEPSEEHVNICGAGFSWHWYWDIVAILPITIIPGLVAGFLMQQILTKNTKYKILQWQIFGIVFFVMFLICMQIYSNFKSFYDSPPLHRPKGFLPFLNYLISIRVNSEDLVWFAIILIFNLLFALLFIKRERITT